MAGQSEYRDTHQIFFGGLSGPICLSDVPSSVHANELYNMLAEKLMEEGKIHSVSQLVIIKESSIIPNDHSVLDVKGEITKLARLHYIIRR